MKVRLVYVKIRTYRIWEKRLAHTGGGGGGGGALKSEFKKRKRGLNKVTNWKMRKSQQQRKVCVTETQRQRQRLRDMQAGRQTEK